MHVCVALEEWPCWKHHFLGQWFSWGAPHGLHQRCVLQGIRRLKEEPFKSQSMREGLGKPQHCGSGDQNPGGSRQHITPGHQKQGTQSPSAWMPLQLLVVLYENQISHLESWLKASCLFVFTSKQHTKYRQLARDNGEPQSKEQTQQSRQPTMGKGRRGLAGLALSSCRKGRVFIKCSPPYMKRLIHEETHICVSRQEGAVARVQVLFASHWVFYHGRVPLPPLTSSCLALGTG